MQVHRARAHPNEYQEGLREKTTGFSWSELELRRMAEAELAFEAIAEAEGKRVKL
jgi:hypothetical protein